jgi:hypothetical protein
VFFETCFEAGYLPNQVKLSENTTHSVWVASYSH